jgi:glyoxylase-like metal-dependent hydrolase (beta-lactamase superfamily II)
MQKIELTNYETVSFNDIAPGVKGFHILFVNVFGIEHEGGWTMVDGGLYLSGDRIRRWAAEYFGAPPRSVILTHGHFDHVGALEDLTRDWDVPVYAHELELPYVTGQAKYPSPDPSVGGGLMAMLSPFYPRGPIDLGGRARALPEGGELPGMPDWRWIHTPGHTVGHVSFFREQDRTLIVGDAFCTTKAESFLAATSQRPEMHGPPAYYTPDWDASRESVMKLAALRPEVIAPGHGMPMAGPEMARALNVLAADFDRIARPDKGKYAA